MIYLFGDFALDSDRFELRKSGQLVNAEPQALQILLFLVEQRHRLVSREDLIQTIWQGRAISDWAVSAGIKSARAALFDTDSSRRYIRTVHGKGFRFIVDVHSLGDELAVASTIAADGRLLWVMPLENQSGEPADAYFADGVMEDLITDLYALPGLRVVSRSASIAATASGDPPAETARHLSASHRLECSIRRAGDKVRISVRLLETAGDSLVWADRLDRTSDSIFALQDEICTRIANALQLAIATARNAPGTRDPTAYDLCLQGRAEYYLYTPANFAKALSLFEAATDRDPAYAEAYAYQSYCRCSLHVFAWPGADETLDQALALGRKAVELAPRLALTHGRLGWVLGFLGNREETIATFEQAVQLDPNNAKAFYAYGETMNRLAMPEKALPLLEKSYGLDSFVPPAWSFAKGHSLGLLRRYEEALFHLLPVPERVPGFVPCRVQTTRVLAEMGRMEEAAAQVKAIRQTAPRYTLAHAKLMFPCPEATERSRLTEALESAGLVAA